MGSNCPVIRRIHRHSVHQHQDVPGTPSPQIDPGCAIAPCAHVDPRQEAQRLIQRFARAAPRSPPARSVASSRPPRTMVGALGDRHREVRCVPALILGRETGAPGKHEQRSEANGPGAAICTLERPRTIDVSRRTYRRRYHTAANRSNVPNAASARRTPGFEGGSEGAPAI